MPLYLIQHTYVSYTRRIANSNNEERNISHTNPQILKYNLHMKKEKDISNRKRD